MTDPIPSSAPAAFDAATAALPATARSALRCAIDAAWRLESPALFLELGEIPELVWSFALETAPNGEVLNVEFIGITPSGETVAYRQVPLDEEAPPHEKVQRAENRIRKLKPEQQELIDLPPANVSLIKAKSERKRASNK